MTAAQVDALGVSWSVIKRRLATGEWRRVSRRVYHLGTANLTPNQRELAMLLKAGEHSVFSHQSAARWLRLDAESTGLVQMTVPTACRPGPIPGAHLWRTRDLGPADIAHRGPFRFTVLGRTVLDLAAVSSDGWLRATVDSAIRQRRGNLDLILLALKEHGPGRPGARRLGTLLASYNRQTRIPDSALESLAMELGLATGRKPHSRYRVSSPTRFLAEVDLAWPDLKLAVELDSWNWHSSRDAFIRDRRRDRALDALGWDVLRYVWDDVESQRQNVINELARAHARRLANAVLSSAV